MLWISLFFLAAYLKCLLVIWVVKCEICRLSFIKDVVRSFMLWYIFVDMYMDILWTLKLLRPIFWRTVNWYIIRICFNWLLSEVNNSQVLCIVHNFHMCSILSCSSPQHQCVNLNVPIKMHLHVLKIYFNVYYMSHFSTKRTIHTIESSSSITVCVAEMESSCFEINSVHVIFWTDFCFFLLLFLGSW